MNEVMKIALTNLGAYNEGTLRFTWLTLPASEKEIEEAMEAIGIGETDECCGVYEEWFITDYECEYMEIGEYDDIDYLNDIAQEIYDLDEYDREKLAAYMEVYSNDIEKALDRLDDCVWYPNQDIEEVAEMFADEMLDCYDVPEFIRNYFDYKAYARDLRYDNYYEVKGGTIWIA